MNETASLELADIIAATGHRSQSALPAWLHRCTRSHPGAAPPPAAAIWIGSPAVIALSRITLAATGNSSARWSQSARPLADRAARWSCWLPLTPMWYLRLSPLGATGPTKQRGDLRTAVSVAAHRLSSKSPHDPKRLVPRSSAFCIRGIRSCSIIPMFTASSLPAVCPAIIPIGCALEVSASFFRKGFSRRGLPRQVFEALQHSHASGQAWFPRPASRLCSAQTVSEFDPRQLYARWVVYCKSPSAAPSGCCVISAL